MTETSTVTRSELTDTDRGLIDSYSATGSGYLANPYEPTHESGDTDLRSVGTWR